MKNKLLFLSLLIFPVTNCKEKPEKRFLPQKYHNVGQISIYIDKNKCPTEYNYFTGDAYEKEHRNDSLFEVEIDEHNFRVISFSSRPVRNPDQEVKLKTELVFALECIVSYRMSAEILPNR